jgi:hypothetical protein
VLEVLAEQDGRLVRTPGLADTQLGSTATPSSAVNAAANTRIVVLTVSPIHLLRPRDASLADPEAASVNGLCQKCCALLPAQRVRRLADPRTRRHARRYGVLGTCGITIVDVPSTE